MDKKTDHGNRNKESQKTAREMIEAALAFLSSLSNGQRKKTLFSLDDPERMNWDYRPAKRDGLCVKDMNPAQRKKAFQLIKSGLSESGNEKALRIMELESVLGQIEAKSSGFDRDPERYYFSVFGDPEKDRVWGWRAEGHHLSLNFLVADKKYIAWTPHFFGANPARIPEGFSNTGLAVLNREENVARELLNALEEKLRKRTVVSDNAPEDIITQWAPKIRLDDPVGISWSEMDETAGKLFKDLIEVYLGRMSREISDNRMNQIEREGRQYVHFAWAGSPEPGKPHYYRIHGPTFLVEYDNVQNNANHIHTVWRDIEQDWGENLLLAHYERSHGSG